MTDTQEPFALCAYCGRQILWRRNRSTGNLAPIDYVPNPRGNITVGPVLYDVAGVVRPGDEDTRPRYTPHHATCPHITAARAAAAQAKADRQPQERGDRRTFPLVFGDPLSLAARRRKPPAP